MSTSHPVAPQSAAASPELFGHPTGLFTLFFAEMWERFSYYGMRALLVFYMIKGFLGYQDTRAYAIYGAYTSMVYLTPYFGGLLADQVIGSRRAVILGGLLMAAGHLLMTIETPVAFFGALSLLIVGNGFFKPNISTMVGALYPEGSRRRDAGFTIFYMGINLGAAMSPILCGYVGETYGWHYGFGLATAGMLIGVAVFAAPTKVTQALILGGALLTAGLMPFLQDSLVQLLVRLLLSAALLGAAAIAVVALARGGLPSDAGAPRDPALARRAALWVYGGALLSVAAFGLLFFEVWLSGWVLGLTGVVALSYIGYEATVRCNRVERERLFVIVIMAFFTVLFWAFFEQAGSSLNNFTDRNVDLAAERRTVEASEVGQTLRLRLEPVPADPGLRDLPMLSQEQLGFENGDPAMKTQVAAAIRVVEAKKAEKKGEPYDADQVEDLVRRMQAEPRLTMTGLVALREVASLPDFEPTVPWTVVRSNVGMGLADATVPASEFQAANAVFILLFGLPIAALWTALAARGREPSTPVKFVLALVQMGLGFGILGYGASTADDRGMVFVGWLLLSYLLQTTGELCLSPVGLSMVTRLAPARIVSSVMGAWFLAIALSNYLAGIIAQLTGGPQGEEGSLAFISAPQDSLPVFAEVYGQIAIAAFVAAMVLLALSPLLVRWAHEPRQP